jgi:hypothetical protein
MAYSVDRYDLWFRTAFFVDKILKAPARGFADRPSRKIRANRQPQDCQGARPDDTTAIARTRRRVDRVGTSNVRYWHKADIGLRSLNVCVGGKAGVMRT